MVHQGVYILDPLQVPWQFMFFFFRHRSTYIPCFSLCVRCQSPQVTFQAFLLFEGQILKEGTSEFLANDPEARKLLLP